MAKRVIELKPQIEIGERQEGLSFYSLKIKRFFVENIIIFLLLSPLLLSSQPKLFGLALLLSYAVVLVIQQKYQEINVWYEQLDDTINSAKICHNVAAKRFFICRLIELLEQRFQTNTPDSENQSRFSDLISQYETCSFTICHGLNQLKWENYPVHAIREFEIKPVAESTTTHLSTVIITLFNLYSEINLKVMKEGVGRISMRLTMGQDVSNERIDRATYVGRKRLSKALKETDHHALDYAYEHWVVPIWLTSLYGLLVIASEILNDPSLNFIPYMSM